jgi:hypothetical protein
VLLGVHEGEPTVVILLKVMLVADSQWRRWFGDTWRERG